MILNLGIVQYSCTTVVKKLTLIAPKIGYIQKLAVDYSQLDVFTVRFSSDRMVVRNIIAK